MANAIDIITLQQHYDFIKRSQTCPLEEGDATTIAGRITMASSYMENKTKRPLVPDSDIPVPTDDAGDEITKYQAYDAPAGQACPFKTMPPELELACSILVVYYALVAEQYGVTGDASATKSKSYNVPWPVQVDQILKKYTYFAVQDYTVGR